MVMFIFPLDCPIVCSRFFCIKDGSFFNALLCRFMLPVYHLQKCLLLVDSPELPFVSTDFS